MHCFCQGDSDSQACEAAGADGNVDMLDVFRFSVESGQKGSDGRKKLGTVSHRAGKRCFSKKLLASRYCDGA